MERSSGAAPPRQLLTVQVSLANADVSVVSLAGELDLSTIPSVERRLLAELEQHPSVVVDLSRLTFIDSSGIGLLIAAHRAAENGAGDLHAVVAPDSQVERVFHLAGVDRTLSLYERREAALTALDGKRS